MTSSLSANTRLKLEQTLGQWSHWRCHPALPGAPHIEKVLGGGISNHSVLVSTADQRFVVRIDGINPAANGINRQNEWYALRQAHEAGLAPCPRYFNPELGALVCDYLQPDDRQKHELGDVASLLRDIHQLPPSHHRLDISERIRRYERTSSTVANANQVSLRNCRGLVWSILAELRDDPTPPVLCHNDLLTANRLVSGSKLWALDWEYSAMASPWCDLAFIINGDELTAEQTEELVEHYLYRAATLKERLLLQGYLSACRYLELLWYQSQSHADLDGESAKRKLAALIAGLNS